MKTKRIFKFEVLDNKPTFNVRMPVFHRFIHAGPDPQGKICMWYEVEQVDVMDDYKFHLHITGEPIQMDHKVYRCSYISDVFMVHVYEGERLFTMSQQSQEPSTSPGSGLRPSTQSQVIEQSQTQALHSLIKEWHEKAVQSNDAVEMRVYTECATTLLRRICR